jgi:hypothetical protein
VRLSVAITALGVGILVSVLPKERIAASITIEPDGGSGLLCPKHMGSVSPTVMRRFFIWLTSG